MGIQRNLKGRQSAVVLTEQVGRRKKRRVSQPETRGHQQFGGSGSVPQLDRGAAHLSRRARAVLMEQAYGSKRTRRLKNLEQKRGEVKKTEKKIP